MRIRKLESSEGIEVLRRCFVELQDFERELDPRMPAGEEVADAYLERMLGQCQDWMGEVFLAEQDGEVIGYVSVWGRVPSEEPDDGPEDYGMISDLVVLRRYRNQGIGSELLAVAEDHARACGVRYLRVGLLAANTISRTLYATAGFTDFLLEMEKKLD